MGEPLKEIEVSPASSSTDKDVVGANSSSTVVYGYVDMYEEEKDTVRWMYIVDQISISIGRDVRCNLRINKARISRHHIDIVQEPLEDGSYQTYLHNRSARPTTFVEGLPVESTGKAHLPDMCQFKLFEMVFRWRAYHPENPTGQLDPKIPIPVLRLSRHSFPSNKSKKKRSTKSLDSLKTESSPGKGKGRRLSLWQSDEMRKNVLKKVANKSGSINDFYALKKLEEQKSTESGSDAETQEIQGSPEALIKLDDSVSVDLIELNSSVEKSSSDGLCTPANALETSTPVTDCHEALANGFEVANLFETSFPRREQVVESDLDCILEDDPIGEPGEGYESSQVSTQAVEQNADNDAETQFIVPRVSPSPIGVILSESEIVDEEKDEKDPEKELEVLFASEMVEVEVHPKRTSALSQKELDSIFGDESSRFEDIEPDADASKNEHLPIVVLNKSVGGDGDVEAYGTSLSQNYDQETSQSHRNFEESLSMEGKQSEDNEATGSPLCRSEHVCLTPKTPLMQSPEPRDSTFEISSNTQMFSMVENASEPEASVVVVGAELHEDEVDNTLDVDYTLSPKALVKKLQTPDTPYSFDQGEHFTSALSQELDSIFGDESTRFEDIEPDADVSKNQALHVELNESIGGEGDAEADGTSLSQNYDQETSQSNRNFNESIPMDTLEEKQSEANEATESPLCRSGQVCFTPKASLIQSPEPKDTTFEISPNTEMFSMVENASEPEASVLVVGAELHKDETDKTLDLDYTLSPIVLVKKLRTSDITHSFNQGEHFASVLCEKELDPTFGDESSRLEDIEPDADASINEHLPIVTLSESAGGEEDVEAYGTSLSQNYDQEKSPILRNFKESLPMQGKQSEDIEATTGSPLCRSEPLCVTPKTPLMQSPEPRDTTFDKLQSSNTQMVSMVENASEPEAPVLVVGAQLHEADADKTLDLDYTLSPIVLVKKLRTSDIPHSFDQGEHIAEDGNTSKRRGRSGKSSDNTKENSAAQNLNGKYAKKLVLPEVSLSTGKGKKQKKKVDKIPVISPKATRSRRGASKPVLVAETENAAPKAAVKVRKEKLAEVKFTHAISPKVAAKVGGKRAGKTEKRPAPMVSRAAEKNTNNGDKGERETLVISPKVATKVGGRKAGKTEKLSTPIVSKAAEKNTSKGEQVATEISPMPSRRMGRTNKASKLVEKPSASPKQAMVIDKEAPAASSKIARRVGKRKLADLDEIEIQGVSPAKVAIKVGGGERKKEAPSASSKIARRVGKRKRPEFDDIEIQGVSPKKVAIKVGGGERKKETPSASPKIARRVGKRKRSELDDTEIQWVSPTKVTIKVGGKTPKIEKTQIPSKIARKVGGARTKKAEKLLKTSKMSKEVEELDTVSPKLSKNPARKNIEATSKVSPKVIRRRGRAAAEIPIIDICDDSDASSVIVNSKRGVGRKRELSEDREENPRPQKKTKSRKDSRKKSKVVKEIKPSPPKVSPRRLRARPGKRL